MFAADVLTMCEACCVGSVMMLIVADHVSVYTVLLIVLTLSALDF
jgi:hypothetical protein